MCDSSPHDVRDTMSDDAALSIETERELIVLEDTPVPCCGAPCPSVARCASAPTLARRCRRANVVPLKTPEEQLGVIPLFRSGR
jgi:hypothetical protein